MSAWHDLTDLAQSQHGVISREQAESVGIDPSTLHRQVTARGWRREFPGVFALPAVPRTFAQRAQATVLAAGPEAVVCRRSAAHLLGLLPAPELVEIFVPLHCQARHLPGVRCCRTGTLLPSDLTKLGTIPATTGPRTLIDLAAVVDSVQLRKTLIDARQRRLVTLDRLSRQLEQLGPLRGIGVLRHLVWELADERCDSILEQRVRSLLRTGGLPRPHPEPLAIPMPGRVLHIDIAWPERKVGVEVDGQAFHSSRADLERDHRRLNLLTLHGWKILRVGWGRVEEDPEAFLGEVRLLVGKV